MQIGISTPLPAYTVDPALTAKKAEELGFASIWYAEHPIMPVETTVAFPGSDDGVVPETYHHFTEPYIALARASGVTSTIKLATGITLVPERNPLILSKEIAVLDHYSGGRFLFGIGAGWHREETEIMGGDFDHRWSQTREAILVMKELWTKDEAEFHGKFYDFPPVTQNPKPAQKPHPPVLLGGMAKNVLRRVASWGDGWLPNRVTPEQIKEGRAVLDTLAAEFERDPKSLTINVHGQEPDLELIKAFEEAGADSVIVRPNAFNTEAEMVSEYERIAEAVLR